MPFFVKSASTLGYLVSGSSSTCISNSWLISAFFLLETDVADVCRINRIFITALVWLEISSSNKLCGLAISVSEDGSKGGRPRINKIKDFEPRN